jgi:uncharacterized protein involved in cysteine biosynthesis
LLVLVGIGLHSALLWFAAAGERWGEATFGPAAHLPLEVVAWIVSIAGTLGFIAGSVFLMPAVTALVGSFFVDDIADQVEHLHYPTEPPGRRLSLPRALLEGVVTALLAVVVYLVAVPFLLLAGFGAVIFFLATAYLLGREYFELAAMRYLSPPEAKQLRRRRQGTVFIAGLFIAGFVSIPLVNLATPLFAMAFMVHVFKQLERRAPTFSEPVGR